MQTCQNKPFANQPFPTSANFRQNQRKSYAAAAVNQTSHNKPFVNQPNQLQTVRSGQTTPQSYMTGQQPQQMSAHQAQMVWSQMTAQHQSLMTVPQQPQMTAQLLMTGPRAAANDCVPAAYDLSAAA